MKKRLTAPDVIAWIVAILGVALILRMQVFSAPASWDNRIITFDPADSITLIRYKNYVFNDSLVFLAADSANADSTIFDFRLSVDDTAYWSMDVFVWYHGYSEPADGGYREFDPGRMRLADAGPVTAIRDSVWNTPFTYGFNAGSMGDSLSNANYVQGISGSLTAAEVSDSVWNKAFGTSFTPGSMGDSLNNPTYVQGAGNSLTATEIADTLANRTSNYAKVRVEEWNPTARGQVALEVKDTAAIYPSIFYGPAGSSGPGADTVTINVSANGYPVQNVSVTVRDLASGSWTQRTDNSGNALFTLTSATQYKASAADIPGYSFDTVVSFTAANGRVDSIKGTVISLSSPGSANLCTVYGYVYDNDGTPSPNALVTLSVDGSIVDTCVDAFIARQSLKKRTDANGRFDITVTKSTCLLNVDSPSSKVYWKLSVTSRTRPQPITRSLYIPNDSTTYRVEVR